MLMQILNKYFSSGIFCQLLKCLRYVILMGFTENCKVSYAMNSQAFD